jgi:predicted RNase H-like HicB family nuclease
MKQAKKQKEYSFNVVLTPEPEGGFTVRVPALPEAITYGKTVQEALTYARECIELCVEMRLEEGLKIPKETGPLSTSIVTTSSNLYAQAV